MTAAATTGDVGEDWRSDMTADEVRTLLDLEPNATCGYVRVTFMSHAAHRAGRIAGAVRGRAADGLGAVFHADAAGAGEAAPDPERPALSLLSRRSDRGAADAGTARRSITSSGRICEAGHMCNC